VSPKKPSLNDRVNVVSDVLFFSMGEGAIVVDERGNISRINKIALDILGYEEDELIGKWFPDTIIPEEENGEVISNFDRPVTEALISGRPVFKRLYYRRKDGSRVPVALTVSPLMHDDKPMGAIELFRDITEEIRLEHAKDEFISIASHQLRTPATVVKQYLGIVLEGYVSTEEQRIEMLKIAYEHNNNQLDIINDLLNVAQIEANQLKASYKEIDLVRLLKKIVTSQKPEYDEKKIDLEFSAKLSSLKIFADPYEHDF
jgi:PAS domain S-box-containing protein